MSGRKECVFGESVLCADRVSLAFELDFREYVDVLSGKRQRGL